jgi:hypothetical protein
LQKTPMPLTQPQQFLDQLKRKAGLPAYSPRQRTYSAEQLAGLFGLHPVIVQSWVRRKWLPDLRHRNFRGVRHCWSRHDLITFVRDRRTWIAWDPPQITDAELKRVVNSLCVARKQLPDGRLTRVCGK